MYLVAWVKEHSYYTTGACLHQTLDAKGHVMMRVSFCCFPRFS